MAFYGILKYIIVVGSQSSALSFRFAARFSRPPRKASPEREPEPPKAIAEPWEGESRRSLDQEPPRFLLGFL